jgi:hypothetical protein
MGCNLPSCLHCLTIWAGTLMDELTGFSRDGDVWWKPRKWRSY